MVHSGGSLRQLTCQLMPPFYSDVRLSWAVQSLPQLHSSWVQIMRQHLSTGLAITCFGYTHAKQAARCMLH